MLLLNPLAEAVTDGLTDSLSRLVAAYPFAHVIAADITKTYAGRPIDVKQIGKDLGPTRLKNIAEPVHVYSLEAGVPARAKLLKGARGWRHKLAILAALIVALAAIALAVCPSGERAIRRQPDMT